MARQNPRKKAASPATPAEPRVQVTGIVVYLQYPDGTTRTVTYDPQGFEALFWSRRAVTQMLGRYYADKQVVLSREEFERRFGATRARRLMGNRREVQVTAELLERLWDTPDERGHYIGILSKMENTQPGP